MRYLSGRESYFYSLKLWSGLRRVQEMKWDVQFSLADVAKEKKCYDLADKHYRDIISTYSGNAYSGIRDRARLGIDDIKEARQSQ